MVQILPANSCLRWHRRLALETYVPLDVCFQRLTRSSATPGSAGQVRRRGTRSLLCGDYDDVFRYIVLSTHVGTTLDHNQRGIPHSRSLELRGCGRQEQEERRKKQIRLASRTDRGFVNTS